METLGIHVPTRRNESGWWGTCVCWGVGARQEVLRGPVWVGLGPGQKVATSQTTDAQLRRSVTLAESWKPGAGWGAGGNTD